MGGTYHMLNLRTKNIVRSRDSIWIKKKYIQYIARKCHTKVYNYILQDEDKSNKWDCVKSYPVKTEDVKAEQKF